ncbi:hypothetical protein PG997_013999 [Apiospora hydei]|uniref:Heterokaryon incompatibility domain-containing protein n=1 Tax=Apiospora hydei TaxID=1337664 RepID=A0ABR1V8M7_9PEZI
MMEVKPQVWLDSMLGLPNLPSSPPSCAVCDNLFHVMHGIYSDKLPFSWEVGSSGKETCARCRLVYIGVSAVLPDIETWDHVRLYGRLVTKNQQGKENEDTFFRVGVYNPDPVLGIGPSIIWIDFHFNPHDGIVPGVGLYTHLFSPLYHACDVIRRRIRTLYYYRRLTRCLLLAAQAQTLLHVPAPPGSEEWYQLIKSWLSDCDAHHTECNSGGSSKLPKRIIDLEFEGGAGLDVVLREPDHDDNAPYIALSYCWGSGQNLTTTKDTLDSHQTRVRWDDIPVLFQDVMKIARALSVRFLWIDALCIIQGDEEDWEQEAQKMASYYGNAWMTIAADHAPGVGHTLLPAQKSPAMQLEGSFAANGSTILVHRLPIQFDMTDSLQSGNPSSLTLFTRAWALQERLLSRRTLHLGPEEAMWECCSAYWCECGRPTDPTGDGLEFAYVTPLRQTHHEALHFLMREQRLDDQWEDVLGKYLTRKLSFEDDRLKAIASLAKNFKATDEMLVASAAKQGQVRRPQLGNYVYGLWTATLPGALLWKLYDHKNGNLRNYKFPTWSWASVTRAREHARAPGDDFVPEATVLEVPVESWDIDSQNGATDVSPPRIVIESLAVKTKWRYVSATGEWVLLNPKDGEPTDAFLKMLPLDGATDIDVACVKMGEMGVFRTIYPGLLLEPSALFPGQYTRVGSMWSFQNWFEAHGAVVGKYSVI